MPRARMGQVPAYGLDGPVSPPQISWGPSGGRAGPGAWAGNPKKRRCVSVSFVGGKESWAVSQCFSVSQRSRKEPCSPLGKYSLWEQGL